MANPKPSLRDMALIAGISYQNHYVPEWKTKVTVREPSGDAWVKFREFLTPPELQEGEEPVINRCAGIYAQQRCGCHPLY
jgi:hypothetical protein